MPTLEWIGKNKVINHDKDVPFRLLDAKYSFDENGQHEANEEDGNMIIHGDNLAVLKSLLPKYGGRVDCIYIDPPYNTGNEKWVYNDNVNDPQIKKWINEVVGKEGEDLSRHDKWLCMMYPRLKLLHELLAKDGYIFISVDFTNEEAYLRCICDEIFGQNNYMGTLTWESVTQPDNAGLARFSLQQKVEPILCYIKDKKNYKGFSLQEKENQKSYPHTGQFGSCRFEIIEKSDAGDYKRDTMKFQILGCYPRKGKRWQIGEETARELERLGKVEIVDGIVKRAIYPEDEKQSYIPFWSHFTAKEFGTAETGKAELNELMGSELGFDTVKSVAFIKAVVSYVCRKNKNAIILDSFAGSGTTAHAVMNLNKEDGGNRKFILVEMMDYAENITAERVKRVIKGYGEGDKAVAGTGGGFAFYELGLPLFDEDGNLNGEIATEKIREYIWYTETQTVIENRQHNDNKAFLGVYRGTAYYFHYCKNKITTLNTAFLRTIKTKADGYLIYADKCNISSKELKAKNIVFKKIPRDITKL